MKIIIIFRFIWDIYGYLNKFADITVLILEKVMLAYTVQNSCCLLHKFLDIILIENI